MKRVIKSEESNFKYTMHYKHIIYDEDNMGFVLEEYLIPELRKYYGNENVIYDDQGIHIDVYGKHYDIQIEEMPETIADYEWYLYINNENIADIQTTDSGEYFYSRTLELIENYIDKDIDIDIDDENNIESSTSIETKSVNNQPIMSARNDTLPDTGTVWYKASYIKIKNALGDAIPDVNPWISIYFDRENFKSIDFNHNLWGSFVEGDDLYICVTDGYDIEINGEMVDPEQAYELYGLKALSDYIQPATDQIITSKITDDEMFAVPFDDLIDDVLAGGWSFTEAVKYAIDAGLDIDEL